MLHALNGGRVVARPGLLSSRLLYAGLLCAGPLWAGMPRSAHAQANPAWFVPKAAAPAPAASAPAAQPRRRAPVASQEAAPMPVADDTDAQGQGQAQEDPVPQYNLPALAPLPPLPKVSSPPTAIVGVLGLPDVMRAATAAQLVQKVVGARRDKLQADYQKEQQSWRDAQQALVSQRGTVSDAVLQQKERALQDRVAATTKQFRARNRIIQEAAQISLAQVERVLVAVIRQVADSRGMNLVLHRQEVALNVNAFDITDEVTAQLNTRLPSVTIPPDGEDPTPANTGGALVANAAPAAPDATGK